MSGRTENSYGILLMLGSILLVSCAQLAIKLGMNLLPTDINIFNINIFNDLPWNSFSWIIFGLAGYGLSMLLWMISLSIYELSFAYPMLSLSYILVYLGAVLTPQLHETFSTTKTIGIVLIVLGVAVVAMTQSLNKE